MREQIQAFTAQLASMSSSKKHNAKAGAGADDPGVSSEESGSSRKSDREGETRFGR